MKSLILYILILTPGILFAQGQLGFYDLEGRVPQTNLLNPAFFPEAKVVVGFPGLGSLSVFLDADRISLQRLLRKEGDSLVIDPEHITRNLKKRNRFEVGVDANIFYLGIQAKNNLFL